MNDRHIAVILLHYNSAHDLKICAAQFARQKGVRLSIIVVDNASQPESLSAIRSWLSSQHPAIVSGTEKEVHAWLKSHPEESGRSGAVYLIENLENRGYSSGNNTGLRLAEALHAEAALIANPDMRIEDEIYLRVLADHLFAAAHHLIAASRIIGLDGKDQNPMREPEFLEELFWPRWGLKKLFKPISYVLPCPGDRPMTVPKVSGACLLLRMDFLQQSGWLDEQVFLYCEEPILAAKVKKAHGTILFVPQLTAIHAHDAGQKEHSAGRMLQFIKSRIYYLNTYSDFNMIQRAALAGSYAALALFYRIKRALNN